MRIFPFCFLIAVPCLGCDPVNEDQLNNDEQVDIKTFSHVISTETEYYTTGPQQNRPPDGKFPAGTRVSMVEESGSYVLVRSESGVEAYVAANAVKKQENQQWTCPGSSRGGNRFALDLYQQLRSQDGNLFFSPSSIFSRPSDDLRRCGR